MRRPRLSTLLGFLSVLILGAGLAVPAFAQTTGGPLASGFAAFMADAGFTAQASLPLIIARLIRTAITFLGILAVGFVLYGGFLYMTAGGDQARVKSAKSVLINALIGLVIVLSSFAIASFVIGRLEAAVNAAAGITGGDTGCTTGNCNLDGKVDPAHTFAVKDWNQACGGLLRNFQPQFTFTQNVSAADATNGSVRVTDANGAAVPGVFAVSGSVLTFTPQAACPGPNPGPGSERCFDANATYGLVFNANAFKSATGAALSCGGGFTACAVSFTTGDKIDVSAPTAVMTLPGASGTSASVGDIVPLQVEVKDDVGGSLARFFAQDSAAPVFAAGLSDSTAGKVAPDNLFSTDADHWNTAGYAPGRMDVWASASNCAGHTAASAPVPVTLTSALCSDGQLDNGETQVDCGGPNCGACAGGACSAAQPCAAGLTCKDGACVSTPRIDAVTPGDGAPGDYVTIAGVGFGATPGTVIFLGDPTKPTDAVTADVPSCGTPWTDTQVIVAVPALAKSGPIELRAAAYATDHTKADRTDDTFGAHLSDFQVDGVKRPGLCEISPQSQTTATAVTLQGINFGASQGDSTAYFGNFLPTAFGAWTPTTIGLTSPQLPERAYQVQVFTGNRTCASGTKAGAACSADADCPSSTCVSTREGSNTLDYTAKPPSAQTAPAIVSVDTGWKACSDASGAGLAGTHCVSDGECGAGKCAATPTWGPDGQYVTVTGLHFGTAGQVKFRDAAGTVTPAGVDFPSTCSATALWSDTSAIVKIPSVPVGAYKMFVDRGGVDSPDVDMQVVPGSPGPGICRIDPVSGPASTLVKLYGDSFGTGTNRVVFSSQKPADQQGVSAQESDAQVPVGAVTGPVVYERTAPDHFVSNGVAFTVGSCASAAAGAIACPTGTQCCSNGTCAESCPTPPVPAHYAYRFSTGPIPVAPNVIVACRPKDGLASPAPWEGWSKPAAVCPEAPVQAQFDRKMDPASLVGPHVLVQECTGSDPQDPCATVGAPLPGDMAPGSVTAQSFQWKPAQAFQASHTYQVTLPAADFVSASDINADGVETGRVRLPQDSHWRFTTAPDNAACKVGSLMLVPHTFTAVQPSPPAVDYYATPISAGDPCVPLACDASYQMQWDDDHPNQVVLSGPTAKDAQGRALSCDNHASVNAQISDNGTHSANITATLTAAGQANRPSDTATLITDFAKPKVTEDWPACNTACVNAQIGASFNVAMNDAFTPDTVLLYRCTNAVCDQKTQEALPNGSVSYGPANASPASVARLTVSLGTERLAKDTYYQVVIKGSASAVQSGAPLSESYAGQDYAWIFRTKNDDQPCSVDRVDVYPAQAQAQALGQRTSFGAVPVGAPDDCSPNGERLDAAAYAWSSWAAADQPDLDAGKGDANRVADMLSAPPGPAGAIMSYPSVGRLPAWCTSQCLDAGAARFLPFTTDASGASLPSGVAFCAPDSTPADPGKCLAVCGDGIVEAGEDCDPQAEPWKSHPGSCTNNCLNAGVPPCVPDPTTGHCTQVAYCGDGQPNEAGKSCDPEAEPWKSHPGSCTDHCLLAGNGDANTCGNDKLEPELGEACDPNAEPWKSQPGSCASRCVNAGSASFPSGYESVCGDGNASEPGKECDPQADPWKSHPGTCHPTTCLNAGVPSCVPDPTTGHCTQAAYCGDGQPNEAGKSCDPEAEPWKSHPGSCTSDCLLAGASFRYSTYCGDGTIGAGEECDAPTLGRTGPFGVSQIDETAPQEVDASAKCQQPSGSAGAANTACAQIQAGVNGTVDATGAVTPMPSKSGSAFLSLQCSCTTDASCGGTVDGCGAGGCCAERPALTADVWPLNQSSNVCRNTALHVAFTRKMDEASFKPFGVCSADPTTRCADDAACSQANKGSCVPSGNVTLEAVSVRVCSHDAQTACASDGDCGQGACLPAAAPSSPDLCAAAGGAQKVAPATTTGFLDRLFKAVSRFFTMPFAHAADATAPLRCIVPATFSLVSNGSGDNVDIGLTSPLAAGATYRIVVQGAPDDAAAAKVGVLSASQVTMDGTLQRPSDLPAGSFVQTEFTTGSDICTIDAISVADTGRTRWQDPQSHDVGLLTAPNDPHGLVAEALTRGGTQEIQPIPNVYAWDWSWLSSIPDAEKDNVVTVRTGACSMDGTTACSTDADCGVKNGTDLGVCAKDASVIALAGGANGQETVTAETTVTKGSTCTDPKDPSTCAPKGLPAVGTMNEGDLLMTALLCQDPDPNAHPYVAKSGYSFLYCRDAGDPSTEADDLPALTIADQGGMRSFGGIVYDALFTLQGTHDGLGVRVVPNPGYLSPQAWYVQQGFTGTPTPAAVDGYPAVQDANTWYVAAPNLKDGVIYPNIYVISYNADAGAASRQAFQNILSTWKFNATLNAEGALPVVTDLNLCRPASGVGFIKGPNGPYLSCSWDGDCLDQCVPSKVCSNDSSRTCAKDGDCGAGNACQDAKRCSVSGGACASDADCAMGPGKAYCDAGKAKLRRDQQRLIDLAGIRTTMDRYGSVARHCSITKTKRCAANADCGAGDGACVAGVPDLTAGTFVRTQAVSAWPSWASTLGNALGVALPQDPLNQFYGCTAGRCSNAMSQACATDADCGTGNTCVASYDPASCFDSTSSLFQCPAGSHVYAFQSFSGETYNLFAELESRQGVWADPIGGGRCSVSGARCSTDADCTATATETCLNNGTVYAGGAAALSRAMGVCSGSGTACTTDGTVTCPPSGGTCVSGSMPSGFTPDAAFCKSGPNGVIGSSTVCGDGIRGPGEVCEIGDTKVATGACTGGTNAPCTSDGDCASGQTCTKLCTSGFYDATCVNKGGTCQWNIPAASSCLAYQCGNGVKEPGEDCDDGAKNGTYGDQCGTNCKWAVNGGTGVSYCGDGYLSAGEQCDCGSAKTFAFNASAKTWTNNNPSASWSRAKGCTVPNGVYQSDPNGVSCTSDCLLPGPSCGDGVVQSSNEACEKGQTQSKPGLCSDQTTGCTKDADCPAGTKTQSVSYSGSDCTGTAQDYNANSEDGSSEKCINGSLYLTTEAAGTCTLCVDSHVCVKGDPAQLGHVCNPARNGADCNSSGQSDGVCSADTYPLARTQTCNPPGSKDASGTSNQCQWSTWTDCLASNLPSCGDGIKDGSEQCDDGAKNGPGDSCTTQCKWNVCGDGVVGIHQDGTQEACDRGSQNGVACTPGYGSTCSYCDTSCHLVTLSGAFCGDNKIQAPAETCDGTAVPWSCTHTDATTGALVYDSSCPQNGTSSACPSRDSCQKTGICNGGDKNGAICTADANCDAGGTCAFPTCASDCSSSCPYTYSITPVKILPAVANPTPQDSVDLYSSDSTNSPSGGLLQIPGCTAGASLVADVDTSKMILPTVDIVFVTDLSGSMGNGPGSKTAAVQQSIKDALPNLFGSYAQAQMHIGLVSFSGLQNGICVNTSTDACANYLPATPTGPDCTNHLCDAMSQELMKATVDQYWADPNGDTPTLDGLKKALDVLNYAGAPSNRLAFVVLLTDGSPNHVQDVADVRNLIKANMNTYFFSAIIGSDADLQGLGAHMSSDMCGVDISQPVAVCTGTQNPCSDDQECNMSHNQSCDGNVQWEQTGDCRANEGIQFAYHASDSSGIATMYTNIEDAIQQLIKPRVTYGVQTCTQGKIGQLCSVPTDCDSSSGSGDGKCTATFSSGTIQSGTQVPFPFPQGFKCQSTPSTVPFSVKFGGGTVSIGNVKLTYCPTR